jgi:hypothetical protein
MKWGDEYPAHDCPRCGCWARSASRSTRRRGSGTTSTSAAPALPDRRHLVADRDRGDHDHAAAGCGGHQARVGHHPLPRDRRRCRRRRWQLGPAGRRRLSGVDPPWPSMARTIYGDDSASSTPTGRGSPAGTSPGTGASGTRTATSGCWGGSTTSCWWPVTTSRPPRSSRPWSATRRSPRPRWSGAKDESDRPGDRRVRDPAGRQ